MGAARADREGGGRRATSRSPRSSAINRDADCFDTTQLATLRFTTEVVRDARASDETFAALAELLSPREIVELLLVIGQYMGLARVMATLEIELDEPAAPGSIPFSG